MSSDDDYFLDDDGYEFMGYDTDFEECADQFYDQLRDAYLYYLICFERCENSFYILFEGSDTFFYIVMIILF